MILCRHSRSLRRAPRSQTAMKPAWFSIPPLSVVGRLPRFEKKSHRLEPFHITDNSHGVLRLRNCASSVRRTSIFSLSTAVYGLSFRAPGRVGYGLRVPLMIQVIIQSPQKWVEETLLISRVSETYIDNRERTTGPILSGAVKSVKSRGRRCSGETIRYYCLEQAVMVEVHRIR